MLWADLAITGDGLTKYETAVTGTPNITISQSRSDLQAHEEFVKAGTTLFLGNGCQIAINDLTEQISGVLQNQELRQTMSQRGQKIVDGKGLERIVRKIKMEALT